LNTVRMLLDGFLDAFVVTGLQSGVRDGGGTASRRHELKRKAIQAHVRLNLRNQDLSADTVASAFGCSVRTLHNRFQGSGITFSEWVRQQRLEACARFLTSGKGSEKISDVAFALGFQDLSAFNRNFKRRFGASPRAWRKRLGN
jgi:AraC family transcriptional regulator, positive regulator of tynA and feaB